MAAVQGDANRHENMNVLSNSSSSKQLSAGDERCDSSSVSALYSHSQLLAADRLASCEEGSSSSSTNFLVLLCPTFGLQRQQRLSRKNGNYLAGACGWGHTALPARNTECSKRV